jgi:hypothetical protein
MGYAESFVQSASAYAGIPRHQITPGCDVSHRLKYLCLLHTNHGSPPRTFNHYHRYANHCFKLL